MTHTWINDCWSLKFSRSIDNPSTAAEEAPLDGMDSISYIDGAKGAPLDELDVAVVVLTAKRSGPGYLARSLGKGF